MNIPFFNAEICTLPNQCRKVTVWLLHNRRVVCMSSAIRCVIGDRVSEVNSVSTAHDFGDKLRHGEFDVEFDSVSDGSKLDVAGSISVALL
jgi:hypothetical protein